MDDDAQNRTVVEVVPVHGGVLKRAAIAAFMTVSIAGFSVFVALRSGRLPCCRNKDDDSLEV